MLLAPRAYGLLDFIRWNHCDPVRRGTRPACRPRRAAGWLAEAGIFERKLLRKKPRCSWVYIP
jgi:hypothetical protein